MPPQPPPSSTPEAVLLRRLSTIKHIILVLSGKGGVGKSSVSVQLALSLLSLDPNAKVGLLDVDLTGPSLPRMLGLQGHDVHASEDGWIPVYLDLRQRPDGGDRSKPKRQDLDTSPFGQGGYLAAMSIGFLLSDASESVVWRGPKKNAMIKQFLGQVRWGTLDYLIVDTPPGTSDEHISLLESLRPLLLPPLPNALPLPTLSSLLVSTPQALALLDVSKELSFIRRTELPLLGLIENMSGYVCPHCSEIVGVFGQGGAEDFCRQQEEKKGSLVEGEGGGCRFLGRVPIDRELVSLLDQVKDLRVVVEAPLGLGKGKAVGQKEGEGEDERMQTGPEKDHAQPIKGTTLVDRYKAIPSFPIVEKIAREVVALIQQQKRTA
ncbi:BZ3500_MvSof-1268-A1-R1_Chr4-2g06999 [Microbotryum saponariae]|uniref:BZ3500_MvSof-1268-A1-R1_Chr4-2g06999 protein n=1 Tax=Microbotryum saponariae TaxID=289078 RepID=A0A2X0MWK0_9BASI|nr:BZ3500_MvSof-1268-A1-R1_Chr4-2g06999 [Microbotryum saponariae]SDA06664.1 BZ3501_MvSof-1269-A2-R1_Chr4-2g06710 [Microbotryum saponariae]